MLNLLCNTFSIIKRTYSRKFSFARLSAGFEIKINSLILHGEVIYTKINSRYSRFFKTSFEISLTGSRLYLSLDVIKTTLPTGPPLTNCLFLPFLQHKEIHNLLGFVMLPLVGAIYGY